MNPQANSANLYAAGHDLAGVSFTDSFCAACTADTGGGGLNFIETFGGGSASAPAVVERGVFLAHRDTGLGNARIEDSLLLGFQSPVAVNFCCLGGAEHAAVGFASLARRNPRLAFENGSTNEGLFVFDVAQARDRSAWVRLGSPDGGAVLRHAAFANVLNLNPACRDGGTACYLFGDKDARVGALVDRLTLWWHPSKRADYRHVLRPPDATDPAAGNGYTGILQANYATTAGTGEGWRIADADHGDPARFALGPVCFANSEAYFWPSFTEDPVPGPVVVGFPAFADAARYDLRATGPDFAACGFDPWRPPPGPRRGGWAWGKARLDWRAYTASPSIAQSDGSGDDGPLPTCSNGLDDDFDGLVDWPADPQCSGPEGEMEHRNNPNACGLLGLEALGALLAARRLRGRSRPGPLA
jgi:hypothetical protein